MASTSPAPRITLASLVLLLSSFPLNSSSASCRSYCGNITIDYPFGVHIGCGHPAFHQLLFCINGLLLLHIPSGSYRVLSIDYAFLRLTLHDHSMSDCYSLAPSSPVHGFVTNPWRSQFLHPAPDNVFFLLGCRHDSPLFQLGFPTAGGVCRNVSGMGCEDYYRCPAWDAGGRTWPLARAADSVYGAASSPPECCSVPAGVLREVNLTRLRCAAYSSAYSLAPLRPQGAGAWSYGIRVAYSLPGVDDAACRACQVSGGACGYDASSVMGEDDDGEGYEGVLPHLCLCGGGVGGGDGGIDDDWNSTSTCDSTGNSKAFIIQRTSLVKSVLVGWLVYAGVNIFVIY